MFLLFVQGGNALIFLAGKNEGQRQLIVNSTGRKWELTFTTLVTFGGAFFASFPLFYSTSFGGAYWVWILILITFVFQAVSYEFQNKAGKKAFFSDQCKEIEENNRMGKTKDLFRKIRDTKGTFHAKMSSIKDRPFSILI